MTLLSSKQNANQLFAMIADTQTDIVPRRTIPSQESIRGLLWSFPLHHYSTYAQVLSQYVLTFVVAV